MKCLNCGGRMTAQKENFRYDACGLPGITLVNVQVNRCAQCGDFQVDIPNIEGLHRAIARAVVTKPEKLMMEEVRFLREYLGFSQTQLAPYLGVTNEQVCRWEKGAAMGATAEKLLRLLAARKEPVEKFEDVLPGVGKGEGRAVRARLEKRRTGWVRASAA